MKRSSFIFFAFSILVLSTFFLNAMDSESSGASSSVVASQAVFENEQTRGRERRWCRNSPFCAMSSKERKSMLRGMEKRFEESRKRRERKNQPGGLDSYDSLDSIDGLDDLD